MGFWYPFKIPLTTTKRFCRLSLVKCVAIWLRFPCFLITQPSLDQLWAMPCSIIEKKLFGKRANSQYPI